jgi:hypothetical protein
MLPMLRVDEEFRHRPFARSRALAAGISARVLGGVQFRRLHQGVYCHRDHQPRWEDHVEAARLALPESARTTGFTRIQQLGIDVGPRWPLHFVVEGDLHLALDGVFLHRAVKMPPSCDHAVNIEAAFVACCADARMVDAIRVGCLMLHREEIGADLLEQMIAEEKWRRGIAETTYVLPFLDGRCRSLPEAELLAYVVSAGLPLPDVNEAVEIAPSIELTPDQWFERYRVAVEYEGSQHQEDRGQYNADIDRYALYRRHGVAYELITRERMRSPKATVRLVHDALVERGYDGPPPDFDGMWLTLFRPLSDVVRPPRAA